MSARNGRLRSGTPSLLGRVTNARLLADLPAAMRRVHALPERAARLDIGPYPLAYVGRPETVRAVLDGRAAGISERGRFFEDISRVIGTTSLVTCAGAPHRRLRRATAPAFRPEQVAAYAETMVRTTAELGERWRDGSLIEVAPTMGALTLEIAARALLGVNDAASLGEFATVLAAGSRLFHRLVLPRRIADVLWRSRVIPINRRLYAAQVGIDAFVATLLAERRAAPAAEPRPQGRPANLLDVLMEARDEDGQPLSDEELRDQVVTFLFAGHETTAQALTWAFVLLSRHPEVAERIAREAGSLPEGRLPKASDLARFPLARAVVKETLRLYPPAWFFAREAVRDTELDGCPIPSGTLVLASALVLGSDVAWPDAELFRPERWLEPDGAEATPDGFLPFGWGRRNCIGSLFAQTEMALVLATLCPRWRIGVRDPARVRARASVTLRPRGPVPARLERRLQA